MTGFGETPFLSVSQTFHLMFGDSWQYLWPVAVVCVVQVFGAALLMSAMDRHFRTGKVSIRPVWALINNSIFPIAIGVAIMCAMSIVWRFVLFGIVMLIQTSAEAMSFSPGAATAVIAAVVVLAFVLHVLIITPMLFWAPVMFIYGYRFRDAAAASFKMLSGQKIFWGLLLPMLICAGLQMLIGFLDVHRAVVIIMNFLVFLFTNSYATAYTMLSFYGISDLERRDVKAYKSIVLPRANDRKDDRDDASDKTEKTEKEKSEKRPASPSSKPKRSVKSSVNNNKPSEIKPNGKSARAQTKSANKKVADGKAPSEKEDGGVV